MYIKLHTKTGIVEHKLTVKELKEAAETGNRDAIRELIDLKGGYDALTPAEEKKVIKIILGYEVNL